MIFIGQAVPYEIGPGTSPCRDPGGGAHLWRTLGPTAVGRTWSSRAGRRPTAPRSQTHAKLLPRVAPAMAVGGAPRSTGARTASFLQAGDPLGTRTTTGRTSCWPSDPGAFYPGVRRRAAPSRWPTAAH